MKSRRVLRLGLLAIALVLLWAVGSAVLAWRLVHPPRSLPGPAPVDAVAQLEEATLRTRDGVDLAAWIARPAGAPRGVVLLFHERHGTRDVVRMEALARAGYASLAVDHRGCGESGDARTGFGWHERLDVEAAVRAVVTRFGELPRVGWGTSLGAAALVYALDPAGDVRLGGSRDARLVAHAGEDVPGLSGVVLESLYADVDAAWVHRVDAAGGAWVHPLFSALREVSVLLAGIDPARLSPEHVLPRLDLPMLLLGGDRDELAPADDLLRLAAAAPEARVLTAPRAGHARVFEDGGEAVREGVLAFLADATAQARRRDLLDTPEQIVVRAHPDTGLPPDVLSPLGATRGSGRLVVRSSEWTRSATLPTSYAGLVEAAGSGTLWVASPRIDLAPSEAARLQHGGRDLPRWRLPGAARLWRDEDRRAVFLWDAAARSLLALRDDPPDDVLLIVPASAERGAETASAPSVRPPAVVPTDARELVQRVVHLGVSRRALLAPAPCEFARTLVELDATRLVLSLALDETRLSRASDGRVLQHASRAQRVRVGVFVEDGERSTPLLHRVLRPSDGWIEERLDLTAWAGRSVTLSFVAEDLDNSPGSPFVAFGDLVLTDDATRAHADRAPHVVLIDADTLRADRLGTYGAARATSPQLDAWAADRAVVFTDVVASSNWTLPSTASLLTGLTVREHGVTGAQALDASTPTLAERLRAAGYETRALVEGGYVSEAFGFDRGFDVFEEAPFQSAAWDGLLAWLATRDDARPLFLFVHSYATHAPWRADDRFEDERDPYAGVLAGRDVTHADVIHPFERGELPLDEDDREYVRRLYDASIARLDARLGPLLATVDDALDVDRRMVVVTSDHGEELFARGLVEHGRSLDTELLAVPLIVSFPGGVPGRDDRPASSLDVVPTVLGAAHLDVPRQLGGRPLDAPLVDRSRARLAEHVGEHEHADAVVAGGWKLVLGSIAAPGRDDDPVQLYDLHTDPRELENLYPAQGERARELRDALDALLRAHPARVDAAREGAVDDELDARLRAMGYLEGR